MNDLHPGKLGVADGVALVFGIVMPRVFLSTISNLIQQDGPILWLAMVIYTIIPLIILYMMTYVHKGIAGDIFMVCQRLIGTIGAWAILLSYSIMFLSNGALILRLYSEYTLLTALPRVEFQLVIVWYAVSAGILCYLGIEALTRSSYIVMPFSIASIGVILLLLVPFYIVYNLTPWQGNGVLRAVQTGIKGAGYNVGVLALVFLAPAFQNTRTIKRAALYALSYAGMVRISFILVYTMIFGSAVGAEKTMPLFELARLVYLNQYLQRIEALFIIVWVMFGLLAVAGSLYVGLYLLAVLLKLPTLRPIVPLGAILIANLAMMPPDIGYVLEVDQKLITLFDVGIYGFPTLLFILAWWKKRREKLCTSASS
ncbi:GerAB/ArcD/ProY family transporter [Pelosinus propionicus]|uniref:Spore germination protein n=1 Tax=Pelosinus propionicus DSM 13327 TaxID=1123291 RepID=A0A1I4NRR5_9FIRM|nr:GerAB/ArcD/ProY family transporter [Pelosinus propionicus]SFM17997.1 Spore germination protein [Pelosinus propionicus DSM 13327]